MIVSRSARALSQARSSLSLSLSHSSLPSISSSSLPLSSLSSLSVSSLTPQTSLSTQRHFGRGLSLLCGNGNGVNGEKTRRFEAVPRCGNEGVWCGESQRVGSTSTLLDPFLYRHVGTKDADQQAMLQV